MLAVFADGSSFNTFEAAKIGDTCLHTTVSDLQGRHQIAFARKSEIITNRFGTGTRVRRYWLEGDNLDKAKAITSRMNLNASEV